MLDKTIELGVVSEYARLVQRVLRETVQDNLVVDGIVGNATINAICDFATALGCESNKGYTPQIAVHVDGYINARFVQDEAYRVLAKDLQVPYANLRAVCEVESRGSCFLPDGRCVILFERHKFKQQLTVALRDKQTFNTVMAAVKIFAFNSNELIERISAKNPDICNDARGGYLGGKKEYDRLQKAADIHIESAYASASYGAFQIMGFNHKLAGYSTAVEMMLAFNKSESEQLKGLASFITAQPRMLLALKNAEWDTFASLYNGSSHAENNYSGKLKNAAARWDKLNK